MIIIAICIFGVITCQYPSVLVLSPFWFSSPDTPELALRRCAVLVQAWPPGRPARRAAWRDQGLRKSPGKSSTGGLKWFSCEIHRKLVDFSHVWWPEGMFFLSKRYYNSETVCPHWEVLTLSYVRSKGPVLDQRTKCAAAFWAHSGGAAFFPVNFRIKWLLWNLDMRFDCAGSHKVCAAALGRGIFPGNFRIKWLLWNVEVHFDCGGSHKICARVLGCSGPILGRSLFPVNFRIKWK